MEIHLQVQEKTVLKIEGNRIEKNKILISFNSEMGMVSTRDRGIKDILIWKENDRILLMLVIYFWE